MAVVRKAVPLSEEDAAAVEAIRSTGALAAVAGEAANRSEAAALAALVRLGLQQVSEQTALTGYARLAAEQDDEDRAFGAAMRARRRGTTTE